MQFESKNIYLQWLYKRSAQPLGMNRFMTKFLWLAFILFFIFYSAAQGQGDSLVLWIMGIAIFFLTVVPIVFTFSHFLYYAPVAIHDDSRSSTLDFIFASSVPTGEIVSNLRRFIAVQNLRMLTPTITWIFSLFLVLVLDNGWPEFSRIDEKVAAFTIIVMPCLIWWLLLETGITAAALPKFVTTSGMTFLLWIIPVLLIIFVGGHYLTIFILRKVTEYVFYPLNPTRYEPSFFLGLQHWEIETIFRCTIYFTLTLIFALIPFFLSKRLMNLRRSGRWT